MHQKRYGYVVIGAGLGGLGAAVELAGNGADTLLLERHNLPGGNATSFVRGRFEFEPSLHEIGSAGFGEEKYGLRAYFEDEIGADIEFARIPDAYRLIITGNGTDFRAPWGVDRYVDKLAEFAPEHKQVIKDYMALCEETIAATRYLSQAGKNFDKRKLVREYGNFLRTVPYTMKEVADAMGLPARVREVLYPYFCYIGIPESRASFMLWAGMLYSYIRYGAVIPRFRSHEITSAMIAKYEEHGGHYQPNTLVDSILVSDGKVTGIKTSSGEVIRCHTVLCNASPLSVYHHMIEPKSEVPRKALKNVNARRLGPAAFAVYLGLNASPEEIGITDYTYFINEHMNTEKIYASMGRMGLPDMQAAMCLNNAIPDCSPPGTTILSLTTLYLPGVWDDVPAEQYFAMKEKIGSKMIEKFERGTGTDIRSYIEEIEIATPQTFVRYTGAYGGNVYAWEPDPWDSIIPRAMAEQKERYVHGLYLASGYGYRAHGYSGAVLGGQKAAKDALESQRAAAEAH